MAFVVEALHDVVGHTLGMMCVQVALVLSSLRDVVYNHFLETTFEELAGLKWTRLNLRRTRLVMWSCFALLTSITAVKLSVTISIFLGNPFVDVADPAGMYFNQTLDTLWMMLVAVGLIASALVQRMSEPALRFEISSAVVDKAPACVEEAVNHVRTE